MYLVLSPFGSLGASLWDLWSCLLKCGLTLKLKLILVVWLTDLIKFKIYCSSSELISKGVFFWQYSISKSQISKGETKNGHNVVQHKLFYVRLNLDGHKTLLWFKILEWDKKWMLVNKCELWRQDLEHYIYTQWVQMAISGT